MDGLRKARVRRGLRGLRERRGERVPLLPPPRREWFVWTGEERVAVNELRELRGRIVRHLEEHGVAGAGSVRAAYAGVAREYPLEAPVVAVGLDALEMRHGGLGGYWGEQAGETLFGGQLETVVRFDLYCPAGGGADALHELYEDLCGALMLRGGALGVCKLWCGEVAFDREAAAYHMVARCALRTAVVRRDDEVAFAGFDVRRE